MTSQGHRVGKLWNHSLLIGKGTRLVKQSQAHQTQMPRAAKEESKNQGDREKTVRNAVNQTSQVLPSNI